MAGFNKRPTYYNQQAESDFFERTPKHVLYAALRDFAAFDPRFDSADEAWETGAWIEAVQERISDLKASGLVR
jgi:hypothetical protein